MAKKSTIQSAPDGYKRQGSIDDENFLYLFHQLEQLQSQLETSFASLEAQLKSSFLGLVSGIAEFEDTLTSRLATVNSTISAQTTSIRAGIDAIVEALNKEE